jgi:hypothetical protein
VSPNQVVDALTHALREHGLGDVTYGPYDFHGDEQLIKTVAYYTTSDGTRIRVEAAFA